MALANLLFFYGTECPHCHQAEPLLQRLKEEEGLEPTRVEVWHNEKNALLLQQVDDGYCGGVPFFFNKRTKKWICGTPRNYEQLKAWATEG